MQNLDFQNLPLDPNEPSLGSRAQEATYKAYCLGAKCAQLKLGHVKT
jgi:hypothetical protein